VTGNAARRWRQLRTAIVYGAFGIEALAVATAAVLGAALAGDRRQTQEGRRARERATQWRIARAYRRFLGLAQAAGLIRIAPTDAAALIDTEPCVIVANHPTLIDVVIIGALEPMDCIVNAGWTAHNPFLRGAIRAAGYPTNEGGAATVEACAARVRDGHKLLIFPEGTRSPEGTIGRFQRGAAHVALQSGAPIVALRIDCHPRVVGSGQTWKDVPPRTSRFTLTRVGRIDPADYAGAPAGAAARRITADLQALYLEGPASVDE
jgi:1-acyl-sn-glycerol-3-phosphate acyltransferase